MSRTSKGARGGNTQDGRKILEAAIENTITAWGLNIIDYKQYESLIVVGAPLVVKQPKCLTTIVNGMERPRHDHLFFTKTKKLFIEEAKYQAVSGTADEKVLFALEKLREGKKGYNADGAILVFDGPHWTSNPKGRGLVQLCKNLESNHKDPVLVFLKWELDEWLMKNLRP